MVVERYPLLLLLELGSSVHQLPVDTVCFIGLLLRQLRKNGIGIDRIKRDQRRQQPGRSFGPSAYSDRGSWYPAGMYMFSPTCLHLDANVSRHHATSAVTRSGAHIASNGSTSVATRYMRLKGGEGGVSAVVVELLYPRPTSQGDLPISQSQRVTRHRPLRCSICRSPGSPHGQGRQSRIIVRIGA